jgi:hypothetical protein
MENKVTPVLPFYPMGVSFRNIGFEKFPFPMCTVYFDLIGCAVS